MKIRLHGQPMREMQIQKYKFFKLFLIIFFFKIKSKATTKLLTIRSTAFEASKKDGGNAVIEKSFNF